jgi:putative RecB family exonuclease
MTAPAVAPAPAPPPLEPPVDTARVGGVPASPAAPSLSPSRAADFLTCPLRYRFRVVDRIPETPSPQAVRGTVVHSVLERLFDLPAAERTLDRARAMVPQAWGQVLATDPRAAELSAATDAGVADATAAVAAGPGEGALPDWLTAAGDLLSTYFGLEDPSAVEPAERELRVQTELDGGLVLRGFVDRLDIAPDGAMRIVDYKTGRAPGEGWEARALFQMRFYALVLWRLRGTMPRLLQLMYLGSGEVVRYAPDEQDLRATERKLRALWSAIESSMRRREFRPNPSKLCDWCDHKARCPAWGGVLPDYPESTDPDHPASTGPVDSGSPG